MNNIYVPSLGGGATKHTELTDKDPGGVIDHGDKTITTPKIRNGAVTDSKLASGVGLIDGQIAKLPAAVSGQVLKRGATAWEAGEPPAPPSAATINFPYALVYSANAPTVWTDLDLSAIVGTNSALVFLKLYNPHLTQLHNFEVRRKGETFQHFEFTTSAMGCSKAMVRESTLVYLLTTTNNLGVIQIKSSNATPIDIYVECFVKKV